MTRAIPVVINNEIAEQTAPIGPPTWSQGPPGPPGPPGVRGSYWWEGHGAPTGSVAAQSMDLYLDLDTGDVYVFM